MTFKSWTIVLGLVFGALGASAQNYTVTQLPFAMASSAGVPVTNMIDDAVYGPFPIGFDFCFYGNVYTEFYIGSNGWVSFSPGQPGSWQVGATIPSASASYCKNCIMAPFEDWYPSLNSSTNVYYETRGVSPCRQLVVTFLDIGLFQCTSSIGTFQVILYETTNLIDNHLLSKPTCTSWQGGNSIHGLHNITGTVAAVVNNRNAVSFSTNQETWRFTPQGFCEGSIDTIKVLTADTARQDYPVLEALCYDKNFSLKLNTAVFCNTVDSNGTDFRLYDNFGRLVQIEKVSYSCVDNYTDSLHFQITSPFIYEEEYKLVQRIGYDGNTIGNCLSFRNPFDTVLVLVKECYKYNDPLIMTNVSVIDNELINVSWKYPDTLDTDFFERYVVSVNDSLGGSNWFALGEITNVNDTSFTIKNYDPSYERRDWRVNLKLYYYELGPPSDSVTHMKLGNPDGVLFNGMRGSARIEWNPYLVWPNPVYRVYESFATDTLWQLIATTSDTFYVHEKQRMPKSYLLKVEASNATDERISASNYLLYTQEQREVEIINVSTPNGDGVNDELYIKGLDFYPNSKVSLFNRWGQKVFESADYKNDWSPAALEGGTYFCIVEVIDKARIEGPVEIVK